MTPATMLAVGVAAVVLAVLIYIWSGGRFVFLALPLLFALPLFGRRRG